MQSFPTERQLLDAYTEHLLATKEETVPGDASWRAGYELKYNPLYTNRGKFIPHFGYATDRDALLAASQAYQDEQNLLRVAAGKTPVAKSVIVDLLADMSVDDVMPSMPKNRVLLRF